MPVRGLQQQLPAAARAQLEAADETDEAVGVAADAVPAAFQSRRTRRGQIRLLQVLVQAGAGGGQIPAQKLRDRSHRPQQLLVGLDRVEQPSCKLKNRQ